MDSFPIIKVNVSDIRPSPKNKCTGSRRDVSELAQSIQQQGLLHEPIVRVLHHDNGGFFHYELIAGERRFLAVSTFSDEIFVKNMGVLPDDVAFEMTMTENLQRKDISCIEEAENIQEFIRMGYTPEKIAEKMGKTVQYISKRSKLVNLAQCFIDAYYDTKNKLEIHRWGAVHLEMVARFEQHIQQGIYNNLMESYDGFWENSVPGKLTADELKEKLDEYLLRLSTAPWKLDDEKLFKIACSKCDKRSSCQTELFEQITEKNKIVDMCLDRICWNEKLKIHIESKAADDSIDVVIDNNANRSGIIDDSHDLKKVAIDGHKVVECRKDDAGAKRALVIDGDGAGKVKYVKLSEKDEKRGIPKSIEEKREGLDKRRRKKVCEVVIGMLAKEMESPFLIHSLDDEEKLVIPIVWGARQFESVVNEPDLDCRNMMNVFYVYKKRSDLPQMLVDICRCSIPVIISNLKYVSESEKVEIEDIKKYSDLFKIDLDKIIRNVQLEIKEPKSWVKAQPDSAAEPEMPVEDKKETIAAPIKKSPKKPVKKSFAKKGKKK
jgi:ParB/RepB/Spo0J family partition protein